MKNLNPYQIFWIALIPNSGIATKADAYKASKLNSTSKLYFSRTKNAIFTFEANKSRAESIIQKLQNQLSKRYTAYLFTDKQFGLASLNHPDIILFENGMGVKLTSLQKQNAKIVGIGRCHGLGSISDEVTSDFDNSLD